MSITVCDLLASVGLEAKGSVPWRTPLPCDKRGVYVISLRNPHSYAPLDAERIRHWLDMVPLLRLDGRRPSVDEIAGRLAAFWLPNESIIYVGKAGTSLKTRVGQFYSHTLGRRSPHCGGSWTKALSVIGTVNICWAESDNPVRDESRMLRHFAESIPPSAAALLYDPSLPLPYANLELVEQATKQTKRHGLSDWKM